MQESCQLELDGIFLGMRKNVQSQDSCLESRHNHPFFAGNL